MRVPLAALVSYTLLLAPPAAASACRAERAAPPSAEARDDFGAPVPTREAHRIVSLNPTTTELLFALGAGDRVVGRSDWDAWPEAARAVPRAGPALRPNVEAVLALRPDLVLLYASDDNRPAAERLAASGVPVLALKIDRIADFRRAVRLVAAPAGRARAADSVVSAVDSALSRVRRATAGLPRPRVFWHVWDAPLITIGGGSFLDELVRVAGGENVYADLAQPSPQVSLEDLARRAPDVILAGPAGAARIHADPRWQAIGAVRRGRVLVVDTALVGRTSVQLGDAAASLARLLHPGALK